MIENRIWEVRNLATGFALRCFTRADALEIAETLRLGTGETYIVVKIKPILQLTTQPDKPDVANRV